MRLPLKRSPMGKNGAHKHILCEVHLLCAIDEVRRPFQYTRAGCLKRDMVRSYAKNIDVGWRARTAKPRWKVTRKTGILEVEGVVQIIVVDDDA
jgi:hypothetical protein